MIDYPAKPDAQGLGGLQALIARAGQSKRGPAPVDLWNPEFCGDLDMEIKRDGTWFYMGTPIGRHALVKLFASVLRKDDDGETYLVTPVEKIGIRVEDAHFIGVEMNVHKVDGEQVITLRTNVGDLVKIGAENPLRFVTVAQNDGIKPYVVVRGQLEALFARAVMYELISHGEEIKVDGTTMFCVKSKGEIFPIMASSDLERLSR